MQLIQLIRDLVWNIVLLMGVILLIELILRDLN